MKEQSFACGKDSVRSLRLRLWFRMYTFSPRYDLDRVGGIFSRDGHPFFGESAAGKILVCPGVQGGIAGGWAFLMMRGRGVGFAGLVFGEVNPVMVQGAAAAGIPILSGVDPEIFTTLKNHQLIRLDPKQRRVTILNSVSARQAG